MTRREEDKKKSLAALGRIAERAVETPWLKQTPAPAPRPTAPRPTPARAQAPAQAPSAPDVARVRLRQQQDRREKIEEEKRLKQRRANELAGGANAKWRGMPHSGVAKGIARTPFDKTEPSLAQKLDDVLGAAKQKESREKMRDKARRQR